MHCLCIMWPLPFQNQPTYGPVLGDSLLTECMPQLGNFLGSSDDCLNFDALTVSYSHGCPHGQLLTWLSSRSVTHMAVLTVSYSHGCPHGQLLTWLSSRSVTHMAVLTVSYSHGCPHGQLLTWLFCLTHMNPWPGALCRITFWPVILLSGGHVDVHSYTHKPVEVCFMAWSKHTCDTHIQSITTNIWLKKKLLLIFTCPNLCLVKAPLIFCMMVTFHQELFIVF